MAQPPVVARQAVTAGLPHYFPQTVSRGMHSFQGCRCSFVRTSTPIGIHLEKFQLGSKAQPAYNFNGWGKVTHTPGVVLAQSTQTLVAAFEEVGTTESAGGTAILAETAPIQVEQGEQPLPSVQAEVPAVQDASSTLETLNKPSQATTVDLTAGDSSLLDGSPSKPDITSPDIIMPNVKESIDAAGAISKSSQEAANTATDSLTTGQFKSAKEAYEAMLSGAGNATDQGSSNDALSQASQALADGFSEAKSVIVNGVTKVQESINSSLDSAKMALKSTYDNINGSIVSSFKDVSGPDKVSKVDKVVNSQENYSQILMSPFQMGTPLNNALKQVVTAVDDITGRVLVVAGQLVANGYFSTKEVLPFNAKVYLTGFEKKIAEISGPVQAVLQQVYTVILDAERAVGINPENPIIPVVFVVGGSFSLGLLYRQLRYGGYSGDLAPASALDLLKTEANVVLIDIRLEDQRESEGIPDLRRQARFKVANVAQFKVQTSLQKMLKNTAEAESAITASTIKNLKNVQRNTKVILLDSDGSQSKSIARALKKAGIQMPYRIDGGFKAWEANGLCVKQVAPETPLTIIKEETEAILNEVKPTPFGIGAATLGVFAGLYALIEWEKSFQLLGLVCICQVLYTRLNSYDSVDDAKNDLKLLLRPFDLAIQGILWAGGAVEPSKLQLATSPSTSAVQDRVLQAAAKHGPLPLGSDPEQQEASVVGEETESKTIIDGDALVQD